MQSCWEYWRFERCETQVSLKICRFQQIGVLALNCELGIAILIFDHSVAIVTISGFGAEGASRLKFYFSDISCSFIFDLALLVWFNKSLSEKQVTANDVWSVTDICLLSPICQCKYHLSLVRICAEHTLTSKFNNSSTSVKHLEVLTFTNHRHDWRVMRN